MKRTRWAWVLSFLFLLLTIPTHNANAQVAMVGDGNCSDQVDIIEGDDYTLIRTTTFCPDGTVTICDVLISNGQITETCGNGAFARGQGCGGGAIMSRNGL